MPRDLTLAEAREILHSRERLLERNVAARQLRSSVNGGWERAHRGVYVAQEAVSDLRPAARHRLDALAVVSRMRGGGAVVSHVSAAVLHGLPQYRFQRQPVELTLPPGARAASRPGIHRYRDHLDEDDVVELDGIRCTSLERTVFDVARTRGLEASVSCADAGLRCVAGEGHGVDAAKQEAWRDRMRERALQAKGRRGVTAARWVVEFADGRAELPGESVSRLQLFRLGFRDLDVQVRVAGPTDSAYFVDIGLTEVETF